MADVRQQRGTTAAPNAAQETARKAAQLEWALEMLRSTDQPVYRLMDDGSLKALDKPNDPNQRVIVVPVFKYDGKKKKWLPTDQFVRQGNNKAFGSLLLMALPGGSSGREHWQDKQWALASRSTGNFTITALAPMPIEDAERFEPGMLIEGRIDTAYTLTPPNPNNVEQDKWYISADAREADIPATDADGNVYYQKRYFENDLSYPVTPQPKINRQKLLEEIMAAKGE